MVSLIKATGMPGQGLGQNAVTSTHCKIESSSLLKQCTDQCTKRPPAARFGAERMEPLTGIHLTPSGKGFKFKQIIPA